MKPLVIVSLLLSILIGLVLARGGGETEARPEDDSGILIGFSMANLQEARWLRDRDLFRDRAHELGAEVLVQSANSDDRRQIQDVQALISRGIDVLVVVPNNGAAAAQAVTLAHEAGIPVIAYDRLITDSDLDLYVTFDNVKVGRMQARYLVEQLVDRPASSGPVKLVRIYGAKTDNNAFLVKQGQDEVLAPYLERGDIEVVHEDWADDWDPAEAKAITNAAITAGGADFDAILTSNDGTAGGAIQALREEGVAGEVLVTGQDADLVACQRIAGGLQSMTVYKPIRTLATRAAEIAVALAQGRPVIARGGVDNGSKEIPSVLLEVIVVSQSNLAETVIADGFHSWEDVYRDVAPGGR